MSERSAGLSSAAHLQFKEIEAVKGVRLEFLKQTQLLPLAANGVVEQVAAAEPIDYAALDSLRQYFGHDLAVIPADREWLLGNIERLYGRGGELVDGVATYDDGTGLDDSGQEDDLDALKALAEDAPVVRLVQNTLIRAINARASDVHFEVTQNAFRIRFRVDGVLVDAESPSRRFHLPTISHLKLRARMNIAERRLPQDGRISLRLGSRAVDVRVSTLPSAHGERAVLRLLDKSEARLTLEAVGMQGRVLQQIDQLITQPHGILLVTGPTGSGKTTSLYAALQHLDAGRSNIMTVEDPIEYELPGVGQTQVNTKIDLTFAKALRAILRQDPDVIMIGEIRDHETAQIAIQASLTGHLVLATLHTNDAASAVTRLTDMGVEPFLLSSSLLGVLAQRLVRKHCAHCAGAGCEHCGQTGYAGRTGIFELLVASDDIRRLIHNRAAESELRATALAQGMVLMRDDGQRLVDAGLTSAEELLRVTRD